MKLSMPVVMMTPTGRIWVGQEVDFEQDQQGGGDGGGEGQGEGIARGGT